MPLMTYVALGATYAMDAGSFDFYFDTDVKGST